MIYVSLSDIFKNAEMRPVDYVNDVLAQALEYNDTVAVFSVEAYDNLCAKYRESYTPLVPTFSPAATITGDTDVAITHPDGPGTFFMRILAWYGYAISPTCPCMDNARLMNANGPDWCQAKKEIILRWVTDEAQQRGLKFNVDVMRALIQKAIDLSREALANG